MTRLKAFVTNPVERVVDPTLPYVALEHIESGTGSLLPGADLEGKETDDSVRHQAGDVRFGKLRPYLAKSFLAVDTGVGSGELIVMRPGPEIESRYLWYLSLSQPFLSWAEATSYGVKMPRTSWEYLAQLDVKLPPRAEQRRIVEYLDIETARIDDLIDEQERLLELMQLRFDVLLGRLVVGERSSGPKAATGHPWWDLLPSDWEVRQLRRACGGVTVGVVVNPSTYVDESGTVPFVRGTDVKQFKILSEQAQTMSEESNRELSKSTLRHGDLLVVRVGSPGTAAVVPPELDEANCASVLIVRRSPEMDSEYLCAVLNSRVGRDQVSCMANGAAQAQVNAGDIVALSVPFPPLSVQRAIGEEAVRERQRLDNTRSEIRHQTRLLREHRQALITAAVTGGLDAVKGVA